MSSKKVAVDTDRQKGMLFNVNESGGRFHVYRVEVGVLWDNQRKVGEARKMEDAIALIKASVSGKVRNVRIGI